MDFEEALRRERKAETKRLRCEINRIVSELYSEVEQVKSREADVRWRRDGGLAHDPRASEWTKHKKHLFIRARGKKIEIPDSKCEKVDIQMNQSKFFETEFEDIEYCDAYEPTCALPPPSTRLLRQSGGHDFPAWRLYDPRAEEAEARRRAEL